MSGHRVPLVAVTRRRAYPFLLFDIFASVDPHRSRQNASMYKKERIDRHPFLLGVMLPHAMTRHVFVVDSAKLLGPVYA